MAAPLGADPINSPTSDIVPLECDNGQTYDVVLNIMLIPVAFGPIHATALPGGETALIEQPSTKGQSGKNKDLTTCSFEVTFPVGPEDAAEFGFPADTTAVRAEGTVTAFITPARR